MPVGSDESWANVSIKHRVGSLDPLLKTIKTRTQRSKPQSLL